MDIQRFQDLASEVEEQQRLLELAAQSGLELLERSSELQVSLTLVLYVKSML